MIDQEQKISLVERALYEGWREASTKEGGVTEVIYTDAWIQVIAPGAKSGLMNGVFRSLLEVPEADARITSMIALYQSRELPFLWIVSPSSRPKDLGGRLLKAGFRLMNTAIGMFVDPHGIDVRPAESVTMEEVEEGTIEDWLAIQAEVWGSPREAIPLIKEKMIKRLASKGEPTLRFLARVDGRPVGANAIRFFDGFAHLLSSAVLPEFRRRGIFRAMVGHRAVVLRERGVSCAISHAIKDTSAPILEKLGAERVCEIHYYAYP